MRKLIAPLFLCILMVSFNADAALMIFNDRSSFDLVAPGLVIEDFEESNSNLLAFPGPLDSTTNNAAFTTGDIESGISFSATGGDSGRMVVLGPGSGYAAPSFIVGPDTFAENLNMDFSIDVNAVGFDAFGLANQPGDIDISIFGSGGLLGSQSITLDENATFFGVFSDSDLITQIVLSNQSSLGELVDNVAFGMAESAPVPEPSTMILLGFGLLGLAGITRKKMTR